MASSFETHRFAMLLKMRFSSWMRSQTLMVRSRALRGVSNHEAPGKRLIRLNRGTPYARSPTRWTPVAAMAW